MAITTLNGSSASDYTTLVGTELTDSFTLQQDKLEIDGLAGNDTVIASSAINDLIVNTGGDADTLTFSAEALKIKATLGQGADIASVNDFTGSIYGGAASDTITIATNRTATNSLLRGDGGADEFNLKSISGTIVNSNSDDDTINLTGTSTSSSIYGGRQRDTIEVAASTDSLIRGDANEDKITVTGTISGTIINGNADVDQLIISSASVTSSSVYGGGGGDDIDISSDAILVYGNKGADDIDLTSSKKHTIYGGAGKDSINSDSTEDLLLYGDDDDDTIVITAATAGNGHSIYGGTGNDAVTAAASSDEYIDGGDGADTLDGAGGTDTIYGKAGADVIKLSAAGLSVVYAGADNDVVSIDTADLTYQDTIKGDKGTDILALVEEDAAFDMSVANSVEETAFDGISTFETLAYGYKNSEDTVVPYTLSGGNTHTFGSGFQNSGITTVDATYAQAAGAQALTLDFSALTSASPIIVKGAEDGDVVAAITGGAGNDSIYDGKTSSAAADTLLGGEGADTFYVSAATTATLINDFGKGGTDVLIVSADGVGATVAVTNDYVASSSTANGLSVAGVVLNAASGVDINMASAGGTFGYTINGNSAAASTQQGSSKNDLVTGVDVYADSLVGNAGNDTLQGKDGADTVSGGAGNDVIKVATGENIATDSIDGGTGTDAIDLANGTATFTGTFDFDLISNVTSMSTSGAGGANAHSTVIISPIAETTAQTIAISGATLTDTNGEFTVTNNAASTTTKFSITGGANDDTLAGSDGADTIIGGIGVDSITGGKGDDSIDLTESADEADTLVFESTAANNGVDTITAFTQGATKDVLKIDAFKDATTMNAALTANPGATDVENDISLLVDITGNQDITTASGLNTALAVGGEYANINMAASSVAVFATAASNAAGETQHIFFATSDGSSAITAVKVAMLTNLDIDSFHEDNFNV